MRRHATVAPFSEGRDGDDELGDHRNQCDEAEQQAAIASEGRA
jgi:hypothetical protein